MNRVELKTCSRKCYVKAWEALPLHVRVKWVFTVLPKRARRLIRAYIKDVALALGSVPCLLFKIRGDSGMRILSGFVPTTCVYPLVSIVPHPNKAQNRSKRINTGLENTHKRMEGMRRM